MTRLSPDHLVSVEGLHVSFSGIQGKVQAVRGVSLHLDDGESLGIVGESGSGKSVSCMAVLRLLRSPPAQISAKRLEVAGIEITRASKSDLSAIRGGVASMIFQDPMTAMDPCYTIGQQIVETIRTHRGTPRRRAREEALRLLKKVQIASPEAILDSFPHQLSGGMLQRAMIAMALSCRPRVLFADEPTTALDVTVQAQILQLIKEIQEEMGMGLVMITHDLGVIAETSDRVAVMYGGKIMETAPVERIFEAPSHPYTRALLDSVPGQGKGRGRLTEIPGSAPDPSSPPEGCPFHPRCPEADARCISSDPELVKVTEASAAACWRLS
ncbi:MAG: ABC transporter ATP-binding protein [Rhodobacter sp.]|nr:ABC transporter ATP-binding protein [Rhodobacter sp.]MCY4169129.1 ABC transporter ATP-binding protein [Rhodobacter sp.]MCY4240330.1 ABC transporter ATP-binding protein [Rhodobacter sp.]